MEDLPYLPPSEIPEGGSAPSRLSPKAVIFLCRLASHRPEYQGVSLTESLLELAEDINQQLDPRARVALDDVRRSEPYVGFSERAIVEAALMARGFYGLPHDLHVRAGRRQRAYISLERYHTWCRGLLIAAQRSHMAEKPGAADLIAPFDDVGEVTVGLLMHWIASIEVVLEGWIKLQLPDAEIDAHIARGGADDVDGTPRFRLSRLRNGVFHFQPELGNSYKFRDFWNRGEDAGVWAIGLERLFDAYFRRMRSNHLADLQDWLHQDGVAPTI